MWSSLLTLAQNVEILDVQETALSGGWTGFQNAVGVVYVAVCVGLIGAILSRTTKSEGLSGSMMGPSETVFKGKKTVEDSVDYLTNILALTFLFMSLVMSYAFGT